VRRSGQSPERSSSLHVARLAIAGQAIDVTPEGLTLAGSAAPAESSAAIREALKAAAVSVEAIRAEDTPDGVVAGGLRITQTVPIAPAGIAAVVVYELGRAQARADSGSERLTSGSGPPAVDTTDATPAVGTAGAPAGDLEASGAAATSGPASVDSFEAVPVPRRPASTDGEDAVPPAQSTRPPADDAATDSAAPATPGGSGRAEPRRTDADLSAFKAASVSIWSLTPALLVILGGVGAMAAYGVRMTRVRKSWSS
jgi:hypothetical protein